MQDSMLQEDIWPQWVIQEKLLPHAQTVLTLMSRQLESRYGLSAEQAFGLYDPRDSGFCTIVEFKRILNTMFKEVFEAEPTDVDFVIRLTETSQDGRIQYRQFCKFLEKRFVRSFKHADMSTSHAASVSAALNSGFAADQTMATSLDLGATQQNKSVAEMEMERPLSKEASLNYILRKAAELNLDLRKKFVQNDPYELSVLPRVKFWNILLSLPLGLNESEIREVFEHDLNFDNYGNVDYQGILQSDIFVKLEIKRIRDNAMKLKLSASRQQASGAATAGVTSGDDLLDKMAQEEKQNASLEDQMSMTDNRKVVVEDLIFIDDLEILIYTTVQPKTSTIFITSLQSQKGNKNSQEEQSKKSRGKIQVVELGELNKMSQQKLQDARAQKDIQQT